jgi:phosphoglycolate phosphatase-like HAD superfamily hydrolase
VSLGKLVLFDIDGTLLRGHGTGSRAMRRAAEIVLGERCRGAQVEFGGALDPWLFRELARHGGYAVDDAIHAEYRRVYVELLVQEMAAAERSCEALPGVLELLRRMRSERLAFMGLLTGNYAESGSHKLRCAGIDPDWFEVAAWGDMAEERPGLVKVALAQLRTRIAPQDVIVVGDTARDIHCAHVNGSRCVAVATCYTSATELAAAGADMVLEDLRDPAPLLRLLEARGVTRDHQAVARRAQGKPALD